MSNERPGEAGINLEVAGENPTVAVFLLAPWGDTQCSNISTTCQRLEQSSWSRSS